MRLPYPKASKCLNPAHSPTAPQSPQTFLPDILSWELSLVVVGQLRHLVAEPIVHAVNPLVIPQPRSGFTADTPGHRQQSNEGGGGEKRHRSVPVLVGQA